MSLKDLGTFILTNTRGAGQLTYNAGIVYIHTLFYTKRATHYCSRMLRLSAFAD